MFYCGILCAVCFFDFLFADVVAVVLNLVGNDVRSFLWLGNMVLVVSEVWYRLTPGGSKKQLLPLPVVGKTVTPIARSECVTYVCGYIKARLQNKQISKRATWLASCPAN